MQVRRSAPRSVTFISLDRAARIIAQGWTGKFRGDAYEVAYEEANEFLQRRQPVTTGVARYELVARGPDAPCRNGVRILFQDESSVSAFAQEKRSDLHW
jgi:hypothetical protein